MHEQDLPTWPEIKDEAVLELRKARNAVTEAGLWLRSDWRPLGSPLSDADADASAEVLRIVGEVKNLIDQAKGLLQEARDG